MKLKAFLKMASYDINYIHLIKNYETIFCGMIKDLEKEKYKNNIIKEWHTYFNSDKRSIICITLKGDNEK